MYYLDSARDAIYDEDRRQDENAYEIYSVQLKHDIGKDKTMIDNGRNLYNLYKPQWQRVEKSTINDMETDNSSGADLWVIPVNPTGCFNLTTVLPVSRILLWQLGSRKLGNSIDDGNYDMMMMKLWQQ